MLVDIVNRQAAENTVLVIVINDDFDEVLLRTLDPRVRLVTLKRQRGSRSLYKVIRLNVILRSFHADVVHCHQVTLMQLLRPRPTRSVLTVHATGINGEQGILDAYSRVVSISSAVADDLVQRGLVKSSPVIYNGIDFGTIRVKQQFNNTPFRIVQVGRLDHESKGQDLLLQAVGELLGDESFRDVSVDFVGAGPSLPYLQALTREIGLENRCHFVGVLTRQELYGELCNYDLLVQPSRHEGFGLAIAEALGSGIPVLVANLAGPAEVIGNGTYGYTFTAGDSVDCSRAIRQIRAAMAKPDFSAKMAKARSHALTRFDISATVACYHELYDTLLKQP